MSAHSRLVIHCGGVRRTRPELATLTTPVATRTWRPVPHASLVEALSRGLESLGIRIVREEYCTLGRSEAKLLGTMDLVSDNSVAPGLGLGLGLRASNDKTTAIQLVAAARVFVCDNWAFSGSDGAVFLKRRHTGRLDLDGVVPIAVEQFLSRANSFHHDVERMRELALSDGHSKELIHDAFAGNSPVMPLRFLPLVSRLYFADKPQRALFPDRTIWSLNNAFTEAVKGLRDSSRHHAGLRIGRYFGHLLHVERN
jgi:Domain of unknown function (DUF932)